MHRLDGVMGMTDGHPLVFNDADADADAVATTDADAGEACGESGLMRAT